MIPLARVREMTSTSFSALKLDPEGIKNLDVRLRTEEFLSSLLLQNQEDAFRESMVSFFLPVFEYFMTPVRFFLLLVSTYMTFCKDEYSIKKENGTLDVSSRCLMVMILWCRHRPHDFTLVKNSSLRHLLLHFAHLLKHKDPCPASCLGPALELVEIAGYLKEKLANNKLFSVSTIVSTHQLERKTVFKILMETNIETTAITLSLVHVRYLAQFTPTEMFAPRLIEKATTPHSQSSDLLASYLFRINSFSYLLLWLLLSRKDVVERADFLKKLLDICYYMEHGPSIIDLEGMYQISMVFRHPIVTSLNLTWAFLENQLSFRELIYLKKLQKSSIKKEYDLFTSCRDLAQNKFVNPCISILLQIVSIHHARSPTLRDDHTINLQKLGFISTKVNDLLASKKSEAFVTFLKDHEYLSDTPLYRLFTKGYWAFMSLNLNIKQLNNLKLEKKLLNLSRTLE